MGVEAVVTDLGEEVEVTLLSGGVMHLADSQGVASVRDSGGCEYFPPADFPITEKMVVTGIPTLGHVGVSGIGTNGIIATSSTISISLPLAFLIGGTLTTGTPTMDIPTRMQITVPHRLTVTSIGKIWR